MSNGYFFAYASQAGARQSRPDWFRQTPDGWVLKAPHQVVSDKGVWLVNPEGHFEGEGAERSWVVTNPGERSEPYVILSPDDDGAPSKRIVPAGHQGYA